MKKQIFRLILVVFFINTSYSQKVIEMQKINGIYQVPCKVNGIPMNFVFDTGAADVTISITEAKFLLKQGLITKEDFIENTNYQIANGDIVEGTKIYLKTIDIDGVILKNIPASIIYQQNAPLLLGQSAISKLGPYAIDNDKLTIKKFDNNDNKSFCEFEDIFPVNHGFSKFEVISLLSSLENIKLDEELNRVNSFPNIEKPNYLNGASVTKITIYYNFTEKENCLNGFRKTLCLDFVDDRLYRIRIDVHYLNTERDKCIENFNMLTSILKQKFPFFNKTILTYAGKNEQIGEGMMFNPIEEKSRDKIKIKKIYLDYQIKYKVEKNINSNEYVKTSNIDEFILNITYVNLKGTKLTSNGF